MGQFFYSKKLSRNASVSAASYRKANKKTVVILNLARWRSSTTVCRRDACDPSDNFFVIKKLFSSFIKNYFLLPTSYTLHPIPYTLSPTPYTLHPTPYFLHPIPYTLFPIPYPLSSTP
ncbi:MAG: hypothetical protein LBP59_12250 [Planctomycetaceae bacterium]|nr:hypothetical protein [Planctomycetaceae bacterium]